MCCQEFKLFASWPTLNIQIKMTEVKVQTRVSYEQFCILQKVNMNFHAKSGAPSLKIEWVMINFLFWLPFGCWIFFWKVNILYKLTCKILNVYLENWASYDHFCVLAAILFFWAAILFSDFFGMSIWTTMQNLELIASKLNNLQTLMFLWPFCFSNLMVYQWELPRKIWSS